MLTHSVVALALLGGGVTAPPSPKVDILAASVQVAWVDSTYQKVRITWTETAPAPNTIVLERPGTDDRRLGTLPADQPNELLVASSSLQPNGNPADVARIVVSEPSGDEARSADFDRYLRDLPDPVLTFTTDGGVRWTIPPEPGPDTTPDDPLDVDQPTRYRVQLLLDELPHTVMDCGAVDLPATTALTGVVANRSKPYSLMMYSVNEWSPAGRLGSISSTGTSSVTMTAPAATGFGAPITLTGTTGTCFIYQSGMPPACREVNGATYAGRTVILHARDTTTGPWYVVGTTKTDSTGKYTFTVRNPGAREYRAVIAASAEYNSATYGAASPVHSVKASTRVVSAKFIQPVVAYGTKPQAYLWVDPAGTQQAALQFKNASGAWQGISSKTLYAGRGLLSFPWNRRGTTQFRWWVPGSTTGTGLKADPVYSGVFSLKVT
ncbi:hypothetical protein FB561_6753 [Kribbella amoyensis]|uniref:Uncharacterized protein n=1 Tax=Kribbella amoyensis TaxID=996641 RepID=A0A561B8M5_9ACTN|nr:hypothetical protein [Kribbella amoyensis]TWD75315.1 hypothetical protein FB561_6753 [Kribbella amoyensis]